MNTTGAVGVDVGGTKLLAVRVDPDGFVVPDPIQAAPRDGASLIDEIAAAARRLSGGLPESLGIGIPGLVDAGDSIRFAPNLPGVAGTPVGSALRDQMPNTRLWVGNDATAACWGEYIRGAGQGYDHMLMVTLGTGIGGGVVCNRSLIEGANRFAGEFGHMVVDPDGPQCPCGKQGCWERFASGAGLGVLGRAMAVAGDAPRLVELAGDAEAVRGEHVTVAATGGDGPALAVMTDFAWWVALGLSNLAAIFDPQVIVVGGGLVEAGDALMGPTREAFKELLEASKVRPRVDIVVAALGVQAGAVGAALLATGAGKR
jgi:glucokinase